MASVPKIPVKKSDGTTVYMTLDEFKAYRASQTGSASVSPMPSVVEEKLPLEDTSKNIEPEREVPGLKPIPKVPHMSSEEQEEEHEEWFPAVRGTTSLSTTTPVKDIFVDVAMAQEATEEKKEHESLQQNGDKKEVTPPKSKEDILAWKARERKEKSEGLIRMQEEIKNSIKQSKVSEVSSQLDTIPIEKMDEIPVAQEPVSPTIPTISPTPTPVEVPSPNFEQKNETPDHKDMDSSLLDNSMQQDLYMDVPQHVVTMGGIPDDKLQQCDLLIGKLSFSVDEDVKGRFCSLLQTRLKGIRTDDQFLEYAVRKPLDGGVGLTAEQASEVIALIDKNMPGQSVADQKDFTMETLEPSQLHPKVDMEKVMHEKREMGITTEKPFGTGMGKPMIRDVKPVDSAYMKKSMGPLEELRTFSLIDLRRLAHNPSDCIKILHQKIQLLQNDSYLLYLDGIRAWKESPLYKSYQGAVLEGLKSGQKLEMVLSSKEDTPTMEEVVEIIDLNKKLYY